MTFFFKSPMYLFLSILISQSAYGSDNTRKIQYEPYIGGQFFIQPAQTIENTTTWNNLSGAILGFRLKRILFENLHLGFDLSYLPSWFNNNNASHFTFGLLLGIKIPESFFQFWTVFNGWDSIRASTGLPDNAVYQNIQLIQGMDALSIKLGGSYPIYRNITFCAEFTHLFYYRTIFNGQSVTAYYNDSTDSWVGISQFSSNIVTLSVSFPVTYTLEP